MIILCIIFDNFALQQAILSPWSRIREESPGNKGHRTSERKMFVRA